MPASKRSVVRVGVAGWDYNDWRGVVYPSPRPAGFDPLRYLASFLDPIEINSTFYGPPRAAVARKWANRVAEFDDFRFAVKLWRRFTHERESAWKRAAVRQAIRGLDPLVSADRLSAVLAQFPWSFRNDEANREWLDDLRGAFADYPLVIEVRHATWNDADFLEWLGERDIGFVNIDQPQFSRSIKPSAHGTARVGYVRVHGRNYHDWFRKDAGRDARYDYLYDAKELAPWIRRTREIARAADTEEVDVVFNNHFKGKAVVNALQFRRALTRRKVEVPEVLAEAYPRAFATGFREVTQQAA
jgi:uncharacterized protein YecE (DUF72 family)